MAPRMSQAKQQASKQPRKGKTAQPDVDQRQSTDDDMRRVFGKIEAQESKYATAKAVAREGVSTAKKRLDKTYADSAVELTSRGVTVRDLKALYADSKRDDDELTVATRARTWGARAIGLAGAEQLTFWDEPVKDQDQGLKKAKRDGRAVSARGGSVSENPHHPGSAPGQQWLEGYHEVQAENVPGGKKGKTNVTPIRQGKDEDPAEPELKAAAE